MSLVIFFFSSLLMLLASLQGGQAVEYSVTNTAGSTPGGIIYANEIGDEYSLQSLTSATDYIWGFFQQNTPADRKDVPRVPLFIDDIDGAAYSSNNEIHVSARYLQILSSRGVDVRGEFNSIIYHEMTHVWQWDGNPNAKASMGLIDGIADYVRWKANIGWSPGEQPGSGNNWDQGYGTTARFLDYCDSLRSGFVPELNRKMRNEYYDRYFADLLGKTVDQLWNDYKAKYQN